MKFFNNIRDEDNNLLNSLCRLMNVHMKEYNIFLVCIFLFVAVGCAQVKTEANSEASGVIEKVTQFYTTDNNISIPTWGPGMAERTWYKNQMTIKTVKGFYSTTTNKQTTTTYPVHCYLFKYKPTGMMYEYRNFSDTALALQKFKSTDSVNLVSEKFIAHYEDEPTPERKVVKEEKLQDTLIENGEYKRRFIHLKDLAGKSHYFITYARCDEKYRFLKSFKLDLKSGEKVGCPVTKYYAISSPENKLPLFSQEIIFLADSLTKEEEKVFDAWEKRAKEDALNK